MTRAGLAFSLALLVQACAEEAPPTRQVHTSFTPSSGLVVTDSRGLSQRLIAGTQAARAVVSPSGLWIAVEESRLSNLVVVRLFRYDGEAYEETEVPGIRAHWRALAKGAGLELEDLISPRVGIEGFGPDEKTLLLQFRADTGLAEPEELAAQREIELVPPPGG